MSEPIHFKVDLDKAKALNERAQPPAWTNADDRSAACRALVNDLIVELTELRASAKCVACDKPINKEAIVKNLAKRTGDIPETCARAAASSRFCGLNCALNDFTKQEITMRDKLWMKREDNHSNIWELWHKIEDGVHMAVGFIQLFNNGETGYWLEPCQAAKQGLYYGGRVCDAQRALQETMIIVEEKIK